MSKIKRKMGSGFGSEGLGEEETVTEGQKRGAGFSMESCEGERHKAQGSRLNAQVRNDEDRTGSASGGQAAQQRAESRGQRSETNPESGLASSAETADGEKVTNVEKPICPPVARRNEGVASRDRRGREPAATDACHTLIGLGDGWGRLTWACARRTRFSPGCHLWGLQPRRSEAPPEAKAEADIY